MQFDNLSGQQLGIWKVLEFDHMEYHGANKKHGMSYYLCECVHCHQVKVIARSTLKQHTRVQHHGCTIKCDAN